MSIIDLMTDKKFELDANKRKALDAATSKIRKDHGAESLMDMSAGPRKVEHYSTGILPLDVALGIGGIPVGRIIELFGPESSGKTTLAYHMMAEVQKNGVAAFIDTEHAMDAGYAKTLGVDIPNLLVSQPDTAEQALEIVDTLTRSGAVDLIVLDSVAGLAPRAELEGSMGDSTVGLLARLMGQACRKLAGVASQNHCTILFTNQIREKVGVIYGSPETQPGGRALKFFSSQRLDIRRKEQLKDGKDIYGNATKVKIVKNKMAPPFKEAEFDILYGKGVDYLGSLINVATSDDNDLDMIERSGAWMQLKDGPKLNGKAATREYLVENPEFTKKLDEAIRKGLLVDAEPVDIEEEIAEAEAEAKAEGSDDLLDESIKEAAE